MVAFIKRAGVLILLGLCGLCSANFLDLPSPPDEGTALNLPKSGNKNARKNFSAVVERNNLLVMASDEGTFIYVFVKKGQAYEVRKPINLLPGSKKELDLEAMAWGPKHLFVIGSHSRARNRVKTGKKSEKQLKKNPGSPVWTQEENLARLREDRPEKKRKYLFRLKLSNDGKLVGEIVKLSLKPAIAAGLLKPFLAGNSKENGIDIEGLAVDSKQEKLYVGFRGPVLRENYVPVMVVDLTAGFAQDGLKTKLVYINLEGRGIRAMCTTAGGDLLVMGGPMGDGFASFRLYRWNGKSALPGLGSSGVVTDLGEIYIPPNSKGKRIKAEGLVLRAETATHYKLLVVYDGMPMGQPRLLSVGNKQ